HRVGRFRPARRRWWSRWRRPLFHLLAGLLFLLLPFLGLHRLAGGLTLRGVLVRFILGRLERGLPLLLVGVGQLELETPARDLFGGLLDLLDNGRGQPAALEKQARLIAVGPALALNQRSRLGAILGEVGLLETLAVG